MGSPRHLWTGGWRDESERARDADDGAAELRRAAQAQGQAQAQRAAAAGTPVDAEPPAGRGEPSRRATLLLSLLVVAVAVAGGAFAAAMLLGDNRAQGPAPIPAVASEPIKPHRGQTQAGAIYAAASPAVVSIRTDKGEGTGFLIDDKGTLVTNDHVVATATHVLVRFGQDGEAIDGDVLGADASTTSRSSRSTPTASRETPER